MILAKYIFRDERVLVMMYVMLIMVRLMSCYYLRVAMHCSVVAHDNSFLLIGFRDRVIVLLPQQMPPAMFAPLLSCLLLVCWRDPFQETPGNKLVSAWPSKEYTPME